MRKSTLIKYGDDHVRDRKNMEIDRFFVLAVAAVEEGIILRKHKITKPVPQDRNEIGVAVKNRLRWLAGLAFSRQCTVRNQDRRSIYPLFKSR